VARITLQIKNVASILLAAVASASSGITVKKYFDHANWYIPAVCLAVALCSQLALIFVESKEEEELSLIRKQRIKGIEQATVIEAAIAEQMEKEIKAGNHERVTAWLAIKENL
jgi:hypothetical protein